MSSFNSDMFLGNMLIPIVLIVPAVLFLLASSRGSREVSYGRVTATGLWSLLAGLVPAAAWLSWNADRGWSELFAYGAPVNFATWQIAGCAVTLILGCVLVTAYRVESGKEAILAALFTDFGFASAFAFGVSFGVSSQEGIGVALSVLGIGFAAIIINAATWAVKEHGRAGQTRS